MLTVFQQAVDATFDSIGEPAIYWPHDGSASKDVRVVQRRPDQQLGDFADTTIQTETALFDVRASDVSRPCAGDIVTFDGIEYIIQGEPRRDDPRRLVWTLDTRPA